MDLLPRVLGIAARVTRSVLWLDEAEVLFFLIDDWGISLQESCTSKHILCLT